MASSSVASLSSGCFFKTELILYRRRTFLRRNSSFVMASGVSSSGGEVFMPATLSGVAEGGGDGCNSELGFCGMSGKSGGNVGGVTGGGMWSVLGMALVLKA